MSLWVTLAQCQTFAKFVSKFGADPGTSAISRNLGPFSDLRRSCAKQHNFRVAKSKPSSVKFGRPQASPRDEDATECRQAAAPSKGRLACSGAEITSVSASNLCSSSPSSVLFVQASTRSRLVARQHTKNPRVGQGSENGLLHDMHLGGLRPRVLSGGRHVRQAALLLPRGPDPVRRHAQLQQAPLRLKRPHIGSWMQGEASAERTSGGGLLRLTCLPMHAWWAPGHNTIVGAYWRRRTRARGENFRRTCESCTCSQFRSVCEGVTFERNSLHFS